MATDAPRRISLVLFPHTLNFIICSLQKWVSIVVCGCINTLELRFPKEASSRTTEKDKAIASTTHSESDNETQLTCTESFFLCFALTDCECRIDLVGNREVLFPQTLYNILCYIYLVLVVLVSYLGRMGRMLVDHKLMGHDHD